MDSRICSRALPALAVLSLLTAAGCLPFLRPARVPMATFELPAGQPTDCLAILLPGRLDRPRALLRAGFADRIRERGLALDLLVVDAHLGYYRNRSVVERLHQDIVAPALADGYREIWLVGASLGGLGTLLYARDHAEDLRGVLALAPFLGDDEVLAEIRAQGGPRQWQAPGEDDFRKLWRWLRGYAMDSPAAPIHLAYGTEDSHAPAGELLTELLPADQVYTAPGGHDWRTWGELWGRFLDRAAVCGERLGPSSAE